MSYQREREQFIARMIQEGLGYDACKTLLRCATAINRYAELACSSEAADRDRIPCPADTGGECLCDGYTPDGTLDREHLDIPRYRLQDYRAEQRARAALPAGWQIVTSGDPRGWCLRVIPPSYADRNLGKDRHNLDAIGVPPGPSRLRF